MQGLDGLCGGGLHHPHSTLEAGVGASPASELLISPQWMYVS